MYASGVKDGVFLLEVVVLLLIGVHEEGETCCRTEYTLEHPRRRAIIIGGSQSKILKLFLISGRWKQASYGKWVLMKSFVSAGA